MSLTPKLTMIGLYNYDSAVFDELTLPDEIDREDFINSFLLTYGEFPIIYPSWDVMKFAIGVWSKKWYHSIERIILAMKEEYNPLHNFDRHEEYSDSEAKSGGVTEQGSTTGTITNDTTVRTLDLTHATNAEIETERESSGNTENTVSAYNASTYQPDNKSDSTTSETGSDTHSETATDTGTDTAVRNAQTAGTQSRSESSEEDRSLMHTGHLYGNIGVTESVTMLMHELDVRSTHNIIDIVAEMLYREICIYVY